MSARRQRHGRENAGMVGLSKGQGHFPLPCLADLQIEQILGRKIGIFRIVQPCFGRDCWVSTVTIITDGEIRNNFKNRQIEHLGLVGHV